MATLLTLCFPATASGEWQLSLLYFSTTASGEWQLSLLCFPATASGEWQLSLLCFPTTASGEWHLSLLFVSQLLFTYMDWASDVLLFCFTSGLHAHSMQKIGKSSPNNLKKKVKGSELRFRKYTHFGKQTLTLRAVPRNARGWELPTVRVFGVKGIETANMRVMFTFAPFFSDLEFGLKFQT